MSQRFEVDDGVLQRTAKWNEGLRIADALGNGGPLPDPKLFAWGVPE